MTNASDNILGDLIREANANEKREAAERQRRQWRPTALVFVDTAILCRSCGSVTHAPSGVLVRYERHREGKPTEIHETDSPHSLTAFDDLPRQVRHRESATRACRDCFLSSSPSSMLPYIEQLMLRSNGNDDANALDIDEESDPLDGLMGDEE